MNWYVTYNEPFNGLYKSQVIDVVDHAERVLGVQTTLVAFVSLRGFYGSRKKIKSHLSKTVVVPCLPDFRWFRGHALLILPFMIFQRPKKVICRGSFALLTLSTIKSIFRYAMILDARGLLYEEDKLYSIYSKRVRMTLRKVEINSLLAADLVTAITSEMFEYFKREYGFSPDEKVVLPCTISEDIQPELSSERIRMLRDKLGYSKDDVVLTYVGSTAPWQSIDKLTDWLRRTMTQDTRIKVNLLCQRTLETKALCDEFSSRLFHSVVPHQEVESYLVASDYGLLLREKNAVNEVCSPIKTAEYLAAGLPIIMNRSMAVSNTLFEENAGVTLNDYELVNAPLERPSLPERLRLQKLCASLFDKNSPRLESSFSRVFGP